MNNPSLIAVTLIAFAMTGLSYADPNPPERIHEKIRTEYRGAATPDYIIFGFELFMIRAAAESNPDFALRRVQHGMQFDSGKAAEEFLSRMVAAAAELESEYGKVVDTMVCAPDVPRNKKALYQRLDLVDDLQAIKSHNAYVKFTSGLDDSQQDAMTSWLEEDKEGFYSRTADHETSFEALGVDVVNHVDMVCALRENAR